MKPIYNKYHEAHAYINGYMSTALGDEIMRLHGSGDLKSKSMLTQHTYWQVRGKGFINMSNPIPATHLLYRKHQLLAEFGSMNYAESFSKRGNSFTIFERELEDDIIMTVYRTQDLPVSSKMQQLSFTEVINKF